MGFFRFAPGSVRARGSAPRSAGAAAGGEGCAGGAASSGKDGAADSAGGATSGSGGGALGAPLSSTGCASGAAGGCDREAANHHVAAARVRIASATRKAIPPPPPPERRGGGGSDAGRGGGVCTLLFVRTGARRAGESGESGDTARYWLHTHAEGGVSPPPPFRESDIGPSSRGESTAPAACACCLASAKLTSALQAGRAAQATPSQEARYLVWALP